MGVYGGPDISSDGLIFSIDAGNPKCFQSGNSTCTDLVGKKTLTGASGTPGSGTHTPNAGNFPAYNSEAGGCFDFAGGKGMNVEEDLGSHSQFSLSMWFYHNGNSTNYFTDARNNGGQWFLSNYSSYNITYTNALTYNFGGSYNASNPDFIQKWLHMIVTSDSSGSNLYLNGELIVGGATSLNENLGRNFRIGTRYTTSSQWTGKMNLISIYNRVLLPPEIFKSYNGTKSRFGL